MAKPPPDTAVLFDYAAFKSGSVKGREGRMRTTGKKAGTRAKGRVTIEIVSEPIMMELDEIALGQGPANALAAILQKKGRAISEQVKPSTLKAREKQLRAYQRGEPWARKRFEGGRTGFKRVTGTTKSGKEKTVSATPPVPGADRKFNHSGRFFGGLAVGENKTDKSWTVNVPANRLDPTDFPPAHFAAMVADLRRLLPELDNPALLNKDPELLKAMIVAAENLITVGRAGDTVAKLKQLREAKLQVLAQIRNLGAAALT